MTILLDAYPGSDARGVTLSTRNTRLVARFLADVCLPNPKFAVCLERMMEGFVLQNALLLKDISAAERKFDDLRVFFDSGFIMGALGYRGEAEAVAAKDTLKVIAAADASLCVFMETIHELKTILRVYQRLLASAKGRRQLRPYSEARFFVTHGWTPADIKEQIALIDRNVERLGLKALDWPTHEPKYTLDEVALAKKLAKPGQGDRNEPRVTHDVHCVAAILTLRRGASFANLDTARAVFATTTGKVVKHVNEWYRDSGEEGVSPVVHIHQLSNIAWIKRPAAAAGLKLHELSALCAAALHPSRETWDAFLVHLKKLEDQRSITSDEAAAIVASSLTDVALLDLEEAYDEEIEADSYLEVVERVKEQYREDADRRVQAIEEQRDDAAGARDELERRIVARSELLGAKISRLLFWSLVLLVVVGEVFVLLGLQSGIRSPWSWITWIAIAVVNGLAILSLVLGWTLVGWRTRLRARITSLLRKWWIGS